MVAGATISMTQPYKLQNIIAWSALFLPLPSSHTLTSSSNSYSTPHGRNRHHVPHPRPILILTPDPSVCPPPSLSLPYFLTDDEFVCSLIPFAIGIGLLYTVVVFPILTLLPPFLVGQGLAFMVFVRNSF
jgi:hypothetical protein